MLNKAKYPATSCPPQIEHSPQAGWLKGANRHMTWWNCQFCRERLMEVKAVNNETTWYQVPPCAGRKVELNTFPLPQFTEPRTPPASQDGFENWQKEQKLYGMYKSAYDILKHAAEYKDQRLYDKMLHETEQFQKGYLRIRGKAEQEQKPKVPPPATEMPKFVPVYTPPLTPRAPYPPSGTDEVELLMKEYLEVKEKLAAALQGSVSSSSSTPQPKAKVMPARGFVHPRPRDEDEMSVNTAASHLQQKGETSDGWGVL